MKNLLLLTICLVFINVSQTFSQNDLYYNTPSSMYEGAPVKEMQEYSNAIREKTAHENNERLRSIVNAFLDNEESAYKEIGNNKLSKANYEGFLFYYTKAAKSFHDLMMLILDNIPVNRSLLDDIGKRNDDLNYSAGYCYFALNDFVNAKLELEKAKSAGIYDAGKLLDKVKKVEEGNKYSDSGAKKITSGDLNGALKDFNQEIEINPNAFAYYNRGKVKILLGDYVGGRQDNYKAIELQPKFSFAYSNIAYSNLIEKNYAEALTNVSKAIELDNSNGTAFDIRGEVKFHLNDFPGSISDCTNAISLSSNANTGNSYLIRGRSKYKSKDKVGACLDWKAAKQLGENKADEFLKLYCK